MKNVLVTGGSRGIGRACVKYFAKLGYRVFFTYNNNVSAAEETSKKTGAVMIKSGNIEKLVKTVHEYGTLDILVNNAGIARQIMFQDITEEEWDKMFDTNIKDMFLITKAFYNDFLEKKSGKIVNISSMWGISGASCEVHYSASKAAVIGFTKALAKEAGPSGINVNCVAPGVIDTDMNGNIDEETKRILADETPLCRMGTAQEVAKTIGFLCSDAADFITGSVILCDGGFLNN